MPLFFITRDETKGQTMPKVETKTVEAISESGDLIEFRVPTKASVEPTARAKKIFDASQDPTNWKHETDPYHTYDATLANELAYCYDWYLGGHELEVVGTKRGALYEVSSKGYYFYVGS